MAGAVFCGPKLSMCGLLLSIWGVIMLGFLGIAFRVHALALLEDLPVDEEVWAQSKYSYDYVDGLYNQASTNCFIAAGIYVGVGALSLVMWILNQRSNYTMS